MQAYFTESIFPNVGYIIISKKRIFCSKFLIHTETISYIIYTLLVHWKKVQFSFQKKCSDSWWSSLTQVLSKKVEDPLIYRLSSGELVHTLKTSKAN